MTTIVIFLEEPSAREMLTGLLPRIFDENIFIQYVVFEGKQDMNKRLMPKMRGWRTPNTKFVVLQDNDSKNCIESKAFLQDLCVQARRPQTLVRLICQELESWYIGDLAAVEAGLETGEISKLQNDPKYRSPDLIEKPSKVLYKLTKNLYTKIAGSRNIGPHLSLKSNQSQSFNVFLKGIISTFNHDDRMII